MVDIGGKWLRLYFQTMNNDGYYCDDEMLMDTHCWYVETNFLLAACNLVRSFCNPDILNRDFDDHDRVDLDHHLDLFDRNRNLCDECYHDHVHHDGFDSQSAIPSVDLDLCRFCDTWTVLSPTFGYPFYHTDSVACNHPLHTHIDLGYHSNPVRLVCVRLMYARRAHTDWYSPLDSMDLIRLNVASAHLLV